MTARSEMMYLTNRGTFYRGWVEPSGDDKGGHIFIDKKVHPNFPDGGKLPPGHILVPYNANGVEKV